MAFNNTIVGNITAKDTIYTMVPKNSLLPILAPLQITGPIIFQQFGTQQKFNVTQKGKNVEMMPTVDGNYVVYGTAISNIVELEFTFVASSPTVQILSNISQLQGKNAFIFSLNITNPTMEAFTQYPNFVLTSTFSGLAENEKTDDVTFTFKASPPILVNAGSLQNII